MARLQLSKSALSRETKQLVTYRRFLPSLDLKRRQLMAERAKARERLTATQSEIDETLRHVGEAVALVAAPSRLEAQRAAACVHVDYEPLPAVLDWDGSGPVPQERKDALWAVLGPVTLDEPANTN